MFLSLLLSVSLDNARMRVEHPEITLNVPVVVGKSSTPTPEGVYLIEKAYSTHLGGNILVFRREDGFIWAVHPNLPSRRRQLASESSADNKLSGGCIGVDADTFGRLWRQKRAMVLQVHAGGK
jgi:hypothetical protein